MYNLQDIVLVTSFAPLSILNFVLSVMYNLQDIVLVTSFAPLSILITSFSTGAENVMYFLVFSPYQLNCFLDSSANSFMIK